MKITKVVESISTGYQFRSGVEHDPKGNVAVLNVKNVRDGDDDLPGDLVMVRIDKDIEPYRVRAGDVLFLSRGHRLAATAIREVGGPVIAPSYFYIIRPGPQIVPEYLAWFINSEKAQAQLRLVHSGTHMPIVSKADFMELDVDVPPLRVQKAIAVVSDLTRREQRLQAQLVEARTLLTQQICARAASGRASKGS